MKIHNVRLGHATNSSSSHSLVFLSSPATDNLDGTDGEGSYGWGYFTLASMLAKSRYLATALASALRNQTTPEITRAVINSWIPNSGWTPEDYIDHQSIPSLPRAWTGQGVDYEFFEAYKAHVLREGVAILGGNDNEGVGHPLSANQSLTMIPEEADTTNMVARLDGTHWVLFDRKTGTKIRLSFDDTAPAPAKSHSPELVDVKITDFCPFGCSYCYQNSTLKGGHADLGVLRDLAARLGSLKVFEVAIGGGEPTLHPDFLDILRSFREAGVVPNFTTRNMQWLHDPEMRRDIFDLIGAVAFSVDTSKEVQKIAALLKTQGVDNSRVHIQYVVGTASSQLSQILTACAEAQISLTLLGYKMDGRGASALQTYDPGAYEREGWLTTVKNFKKMKDGWKLAVGVDTALIQHAGAAKLEKAGIHESLYTKREGAFSMYVDAVARTMAPASYACEGQDVPMPEFNRYADKTPDPILDAFAKF